MKLPSTFTIDIITVYQTKFLVQRYLETGNK